MHIPPSNWIPRSNCVNVITATDHSIRNERVRLKLCETHKSKLLDCFYVVNRTRNEANQVELVLAQLGSVENSTRVRNEHFIQLKSDTLNVHK